MEIIDCKQNTIEWEQEKLGKPSASGCSKIITAGRKPSKQREGYLYELVAERITGKKAESYTNANMEEGHAREQEAVDFFCLTQNVEIERVGLIYKDESRKCCCSPDGLIIGKSEGIEVKNPLGKTQVKYLLDGGLPSEYFGQVQFSLYVTGFKIWHFLSYTPAMKPLHIAVKRDEVFIKALAVELELFCNQLDEITNKIK